jgi:DNA-binding response OmpR family regulator
MTAAASLDTVHHAPGTPTAMPSVEPPAVNPRRLLIAEDDPHTMFPLREFFCDQGFTVDCVIGPREAERMLDQFPYSVVLTDFHLTEHRRGEGLLVLEQARRRQPEIRAIMMTAFPSRQLEFDARRVGADLILSKPIALVALNHAVSGPTATASRQECRTF